jgi:stalled ribosome rescue protein Dom34
MKILKKIAVYMDHSSAHIIDPADETIQAKTIESAFTHFEKEQTLSKSEKGMHSKEQHQQSTYYKELADKLRNYNSVLLFGPTHAKAELFNLLKDDPHFDNIRIDVKQTDKLTENQEHAFAREYFAEGNFN